MWLASSQDFQDRGKICTGQAFKFMDNQDIEDNQGIEAVNLL